MRSNSTNNCTTKFLGYFCEGGGATAHSPPRPPPLVVYRISADKSKWSEDQSVGDYKSLICYRINEVTYLPFDQPEEVALQALEKWPGWIFISYKKPCF